MKRAVAAIAGLSTILLSGSAAPSPPMESSRSELPKFADPMGVWRDRQVGWLEASTTQQPVALGELSKRCIPNLLANCKSFAGGYLSAPGRPRIYWQLQEGDPGENDGSAGLSLLVASGENLIPIFWTTEANYYERPVVFWKVNGVGPFIAIAGVMAGNGHYNADAVFRWTNGPYPLVPVQTANWMGPAPAPLPPNLWISKGLSLRYHPSGALISETSLWRAEDGDCCPTGGSAILTFDIENDALVLTDATYRPPETQD